MKALALLVALALTVLAASVLTTAQPRGKLPVVGVLDPGTSDALSDRKSGRLYAFLQGLRELGYIEEQTLHLEYRFADEQWDRLPALAVELVQRKPDIIVTGSIPAVLAAKQATTTIPIVLAAGGDLVALGHGASYIPGCLCRGQLPSPQLQGGGRGTVQIP